MELPKTYEPDKTEPNVYRRWLEAKAFHADPDGGGKRYGIVIPPPNVTDRLHVGHALNNVLQDILVRFRRMGGFNTLWMPGTDHAGIATQTVVEKRILAEEGKRRTDFAREDFVARVQAWKDEYEADILSQLKAMGCSCDWDRTRFTMDDVCAAAVRAAFFRLFADGLIYRGKRLVNWDPATQTVLADDEVEHETVQGHFWYLRYPLVGGTVGVSPADMLHALRSGGVPVLPEYVTVATTRPETMLGDTAVAINPADPRAEALVGQHVRLPIVGRIIPIIADDSVVLPDPDSADEKARFSTGFLKVTPAHDPTDWEIGQRHGLPVVNVLAPDGSISDRHGWDDCTTPEARNLVGMDRFEAREAVVEWFGKEGLLEDVRPYAHEVGHSYRSHVPIEPYLSDQWFIDVKKPIANCQLPIADWTAKGLVEDRDAVHYIKGTNVPANSLAGLALAPLLDGQLRFVPERYANTYRAWLENLRDWPISRQLWWGHRIPVWSQDLELPKHVRSGRAEGHECDARIVAALDRAVGGDFDKDFRKFFARFMLVIADEAPQEDCIRTYLCLDRDEPDCIAWMEKSGWVRDPDVLDTWFSSALWPISTMGWPQETDLLKAFYPTDVLCTAREIITLWVSRMVMFGQYFRGRIPFRDVYIHAMIQDGQGRKMSKSLGNGIDPLDIIASHGADALRFTLASMSTETQDVRMPVEEMTLPDGRKARTSPKFDLGRNFCNKLWNAARFALMNLQATPPWSQAGRPTDVSDRWILSRLNDTVRQVTGALENYRFHDAAGALYRYMWNDFCDWYLEIVKVRLAAGETACKAVLAHALDVLLRLLHPLVPFVTEEIWSHLNETVRHRGPSDSPAEAMLVRAAWPQAQPEWIDPVLESRFAGLQELVSGIREARSRHNVAPGRKVSVTLQAGGQDTMFHVEQSALIQALAGVESLRADRSAEPGASDATVVVGSTRAFVHGVVDRQAELTKLTKRRQTLQRGIASAEGKLANAAFLRNAPPEVVALQRQRLGEMREELSGAEKSLAALG